MKKFGIGLALCVLSFWASAASAESRAEPPAPACQKNCSNGINYSDWLQQPSVLTPAASALLWEPSSVATKFETNFNFHEQGRSKFDGSNLLFMIMGVGGLGAAIAFGGGGGSSKSAPAPAMTVTLTPPTTLAIKGYQIQQGGNYQAPVTRTTEIDEHAVISCKSTVMTRMTGAPYTTYVEVTTTLNTPQREVVSAPEIPTQAATVTLAQRHFAETLTVSIDITTTLIPGTTSTMRVARRVEVYNPQPIIITFNQISARAAPVSVATVTTTVVHELATEQITVQIEGRTAPERALARGLVALPPGGKFSVTVVNVVTLEPMTTEVTTTLTTSSYDNRHYAFRRGGTATLTWQPASGAPEELTLANDFNGDNLASLAHKYTLNVYGVNFHHTLASLADNKYFTTVTGENSQAITLTTYSPRQALNATLLFAPEEAKTKTMTMTSGTSTTTVTTTLSSLDSLSKALSLMTLRGVYNTESNNEGRTIYLLSPYKIPTVRLAREKFEANFPNPRFLIFKRYTSKSGMQDRFIQLTSTFFRKSNSPPVGQFHPDKTRRCLSYTETTQKNNGLYEHFYLHQGLFEERSGPEEIYPTEAEKNILRFNHYRQNTYKVKIANFAFSHSGELNDLAAEFSTDEYVSGRLKLQAAIGVRKLRANNTQAQYYANYFNYSLGPPPLKSIIYRNKFPRWHMSAHFVGGRVLSDYYENGRLLGYGARLYGSNLFTPGDFWHVGINSPFADRRLGYKILSFGTVLGDAAQNLILDYQHILNAPMGRIKLKYRHDF